MAEFSVLILTANPPGVTGSSGAMAKIDGREAMLKTVELFLNRENVKQIQIVFAPEQVEEAKRKHGGHFGFSGVKVATGGPKWMDQWAAGAEKLSASATHVIVHDAARPAVPFSDIDALLAEAEKHPAVTLVAPVRSSLIEVDEGGNAVAVHPASQFVQLLTPQAYSVAKFKELAASKQEPHASQFKLLQGSPLNVRIGGGTDASFVRSMIGMLPKPKAKPLNNPFEEAQW